MSIAHKNTGDTVTATDYNVIADDINNSVPNELTEDTVVDIGENKLTISATEDPANNLSVEFYDEGITSRSTNTENSDFSAWYQSIQHQRFYVQVAGVNDTYVFCETDRVEIGYEDLVNVSRITMNGDGCQVEDGINELGLFDAADYSVKGKQNPLWKATWGSVLSLFDKGKTTLVNGQVTVNSTLVKTISRQITLGYTAPSGTIGILVALDADIVDNTSFIIKSLNPDGSVNTADNSQVRYCVIGD